MRTTRRQFLKAAGAVSAAALLGQLSRCAPSEPPPNVVVLFSDELSPDFLSCYGGDISTPNLDKLAAEGMRFTNAFTAAPMCTPSRFAVLTGTYPGRCSHPTFLEEYPYDQPYSVAWNTFIDASIPTMARRLSENGYITGATGKWHVGDLSDESLFPSLDVDADPADPDVDEQLREHQAAVCAQVKADAGFDQAINMSWDNFDTFPVKKLQYHNFPWINQGAVQFLEQAKDVGKPFFLYAATTAVHGPAHQAMFNYDLSYTFGGHDPDVLNYMPPVKEIQQRLENAPSWESHKLAGMACLDHHVGLVMETLEQLGVADNTLVIFIADHNVEPGKATAYHKGNHVPMLIKWPKHVQPGSVADALVQSTDLAPTLYQAAGISVQDPLDGQSLLPLLSDPSTRVHELIYLESGYTRALTDGRYKYIAFRPPQPALNEMKTGTTRYAPNHLNVFKQAHSQIALEHYPHYFDADQLYDLENDPYEQNNVANDPAYAEVLQRLKDELARRLTTFKHPFEIEADDFMTTETYDNLAANTRAIGTDFIEWLPRDHGKIVWPPEE